MPLCSRRWSDAYPKSPRGDSWGSADRADLRGEGLRESAGAAGDMVGGGSSAVFLTGRRYESFGFAWCLEIVASIVVRGNN